MSDEDNLKNPEKDPKKESLESKADDADEELIKDIKKDLHEEQTSGGIHILFEKQDKENNKEEITKEEAEAIIKLGLRPYDKNKKLKPPENKQNKYKRRALLFAAFAGLWGYFSVSNLWDMHKFDKHVCRHIEIAANVPTAGSSNGSDLSMESALQDAQENLGVARLQNPAIIWKTPVTDVGVLENLLKKAIERSRQIQSFKESYEAEEPSQEWPEWVREAHQKLKVHPIMEGLDKEQKKTILKFYPVLEELTESEYGQRIASEYEALNNVVAGGTRISAKSLKERHRSLLDTLERAGGWRSIIRFQADDYKEAYARVFVGYLYANMGCLDNSLVHFREAKKIMDQYDDDKNLAIWRNTPELRQSTIKGLIDSSIRELEALNNDPTKYSTGWWKRLIYYNQSIGGQTNPSISDIGDNIYYRHQSRAFWCGIVALLALGICGLYTKKYRLAKKYEVEHE